MRETKVGRGGRVLRDAGGRVGGHPGLRVADGVTLVNDGMLTNTAGGCYTYLENQSVLQNAGTLVMQDNSGVEPSAVQLVNQPGGTITYAGGPVGASLAVPVTEDGTIQTSGDTLSLASSYTSAGTATLKIAISSANDHGRLAISRTASLAGTLTLQTAGSYQPPIGTSITILTAGKRTGTFSKIIGTMLTGEQWSVGYTATRVNLTAISG